jgi:hypothetical protein
MMQELTKEKESHQEATAVLMTEWMYAPMTAETELTHVMYAPMIVETAEPILQEVTIEIHVRTIETEERMIADKNESQRI